MKKNNFYENYNQFESCDYREDNKRGMNEEK